MYIRLFHRITNLLKKKIKKIEEGSLQIGYGSDKVEEEKTQCLMWQEGDLQYLIMDMGTEIPKDEFVNMAKQVIDMQ